MGGNFDSEKIEITKQWWETITATDPGSIAMLKRADSTLEIMLSEQFFNLVKKTGCTSYVEIEKLSYIAMVISHVKTDSISTMPTLMGAYDKRGEPTVSESRLHRLISADIKDAVRQMIRILPMIDSSANIKSLASSIWYWDYESQITKKEWVKEYYLSNERRRKE